MTAQENSNFPVRLSVLNASTFMIVAMAAMAMRNPVAVAYPFAALLLFLWIVSDTMILSLVARSSGRPMWHAVLGVMAGASFTVWLGSPPSIREVLSRTPVIAAGMAAVVLAHIMWATARARHALSRPGEAAKDRWVAAAAMILPAELVRLAAAELTVIHMALFRWGGPADLPDNSRAFTYHQHLTPMCATLLILSAIEIAVYHLLVGHWSRTAAIVMFLLSDVGFVYLIGLTKSFRFRPILLTQEGVRIRAGFLVDQYIPLDEIAGIETNFASDQVRDRATLNASLLAWPNVLLRLKHPIYRRSLLKRNRSFTTVAFRLDDMEPFVRLLLWRLGHTPHN